MTRRQLTDEQWEFIEPYLPIGEYGPYPARLREQFEGVIWRFRSSASDARCPPSFGPWATVYGRFRVWRDAGVCSALLEGVIAEAAPRGQTDLSLVSVDSTTARAHHDAAGMHIGKDVMEALEEAAAEQERARQKGGGPPEQNGQDGRDDPEQEERRRIRRRRKLRLNQALLVNAPRPPRPPRHAPTPPRIRFAKPPTPPRSSTSRAYAQPDRPDAMRPTGRRPRAFLARSGPMEERGGQSRADLAPEAASRGRKCRSCDRLGCLRPGGEVARPPRLLRSAHRPLLGRFRTWTAASV